MYKKSLTPEQKERFKELYLKGYSAPYIFKELGQDYGFKNQLANCRMMRLRNELKLPKRGIGYKPKFTCSYLSPEDEKREAELRYLDTMEKIKGLERRILFYSERISYWKSEIGRLKRLSPVK